MASNSLLAEKENENLLSFRLRNALCKIGGWESSKEFGEKEGCISQEEVMVGSNGGGKSVVRLIKLPYVEKIPPYTSWIFLDK